MWDFDCFAGLQSVLHDQRQSAGSIVGLTDGRQQRADHDLRTDSARHLHGARASVHIDGRRSNVESGKGENAAR